MPPFSDKVKSEIFRHYSQISLMPRSLSVLTCLYPVATNTNFFKTANPKEFKKPFPVQSPAHVAKKMVKGIERKKKYVYPCGLFTFARFLFAICPPIKTIYWKMETKKLKDFIKNNK